MADVWAALRAERSAAADYFSTLSPSDWDLASQCDGWTNRDVLAHMSVGAANTPPKFVGGMVRAGFSFQRFIANQLASQTGRQPQDLLGDFRSRLGAHTQPGNAMLAEAIIHAEDVRLSVGRGTIAHDPKNVATAAQYYTKGGGPVRVKPRIAGLRLEADDTAWAHGTGPVVRGPILAILLAMAGRRKGLDRLSGEGLPTLATRN